jgi:hypothetical protein
MSDLDLMEPLTEQELKLEAATEAAAPGPGATPESVWPREQMLDRLRTCD